MASASASSKSLEETFQPLDFSLGSKNNSSKPKNISEEKYICKESLLNTNSNSDIDKKSVMKSSLHEILKPNIQLIKKPLNNNSSVQMNYNQERNTENENVKCYSKGNATEMETLLRNDRKTTFSIKHERRNTFSPYPSPDKSFLPASYSTSQVTDNQKVLSELINQKSNLVENKFNPELLRLQNSILNNITQVTKPSTPSLSNITQTAKQPTPFLSQLQNNPLLFSTLSSFINKSQNSSFGMFSPQCSPELSVANGILSPFQELNVPNPLLSQPQPSHVTDTYQPQPQVTDAFPASLCFGSSRAEALLTAHSNDAYLKFRQQMLSKATTCKARRRKEASHSPESHEQDTKGDSDSGEGSSEPTREAGRDSAYWERRRKNNAAAKRSRDARRAKEDEVAVRAAFLEQENVRLRVEVAGLRAETARLRCALCNG